MVAESENIHDGARDVYSGGGGGGGGNADGDVAYFSVSDVEHYFYGGYSEGMASTPPPPRTVVHTSGGMTRRVVATPPVPASPPPTGTGMVWRCVECGGAFSPCSDHTLIPVAFCDACATALLHADDEDLDSLPVSMRGGGHTGAGAAAAAVAASEEAIYNMVYERAVYADYDAIPPFDLNDPNDPNL